MLQTERFCGNPKRLGPLTLAFIGDGVYELMVRERLLGGENLPVGKLHRRVVSRVCAAAQARAYDAVLPLLNEEELSILKRGRNAAPQSTPKNADLGDYHKATGLEALFGYLYLRGESERLGGLFAAAMAGEEEADGQDG